MTIPTSPAPNEEWTNPETGVTYTWTGERWVIYAEPEPTHDLEYVLNNGAVADKGILLTDAEDALIALAPDEATLDIASDTEKKNPRLRLTHIDKLNYPDAQAQIELDNNGTRVDFEFFQDIDECHFRFDNEEKFVLNRDGDAQFIGKVEGEPGTQNNEFVTYGQLTTLEEEIEQLAPSLERGSWTYTANYPPGEGEYTLVKEILDEDEQEALCEATYAQCLIDNDGDPLAQQACTREWGDCKDAITGTKVITTDQFVETTRIYFNDVDANGTTHSWAEIPPDHFIDIFNEADENFLVGDITSHTGGNFTIDVMSSKGTASGIATVKIFRTQGTVDFDSYVRKSGDEMSGPLDMKFNPIENAGRFEHEVIETLTSNTKRAKDIYLFQRDGKGETYLGVNGTVWVPELLNTKLDLDGNAVPWSNIEVGDYIKIHENGHSSNRYSIFGPVTKITEYETEGINFVGIGFENHHAIVNGPLVIRVNQKVTISRVQLSGKESNIITDFGGEIHGRVVIRHPGAGPVEIHASDIGDNYAGSGIQIYGMEDKKFVEISSADGRLKCYNRDGSHAGANSYADVVTRGYLIQDYGSYNHLPPGFEFNLMYMENASDSQAKEHARKTGQWAKTNNGIWINRYDKHRLVDLSPYYTSNQGTFTNPNNEIEEDIDGEVSTFSNEVILDYQGAYGQRAFLSIYQEYNRDKLGLRRVTAISRVIWYKYEPYIKLEWSKNFNLDSVYYTKCILSLPGII